REGGSVSRPSAVGQNQQSDTPSKSSRPHRCPREGPLSREAVGGSRRVRAERRSGRSAHRADGPRCIIAGRSGWRRGARARVHRESGRGRRERRGGEEAGCQSGATERDRHLAHSCGGGGPPSPWRRGGHSGGPPFGRPPRGRDRHHPPRPGPHVGQWALGGTESAHPCGVQCRAPSKTGERAWQTRRAREGSREGEEKEEQEQQKHEDEKEALKRGTKKLAPTRRRATLPRAREEPAGEARRRRASRRRHISGAPRRAEAARRRTGGSGERHQHTSADVRVESERPP
ncbi:unnamed protein product, partial [Prorocentrum cordatum]